MNNMKYLKLYENVSNWNQRLRTNVKDRKIFSELIKQYLYWKLGKKEENGYYIYIFNFYFKEGKLIISYDQGGDDSEYFKVENYNEFLKFIDNPNLFIQGEKYNL